MLTEIIQAQKDKYCMILLMHRIKIFDLLEVESTVVATRGHGQYGALWGGDRERLIHGY
jgi:hypothetical protein